MGWSTFTCTCQGLICLGFVWAMKNAVVLICRQPVIVAKCTVTLFIIVTAFLAPSLRSTVQGPRSTVHRDEPRPFACLSAYVAGRVGTRLGEESDGSTPAAWPLWGFGTEHAVQSLSFAPHASIRQQVHCSNSAASFGPLLCCAECKQLCGAASLALEIQSPFAQIKGVIEGKKSLAIHIACVCRKGSRRRGPNYSQVGANWRCIRRFFFLINTLTVRANHSPRAFKDGLLTSKGLRGVRNCFQGSCSNIQGLNHY